MTGERERESRERKIGVGREVGNERDRDREREGERKIERSRAERETCGRTHMRHARPRQGLGSRVASVIAEQWIDITRRVRVDQSSIFHTRGGGASGDGEKKER